LKNRIKVLTCLILCRQLWRLIIILNEKLYKDENIGNFYGKKAGRKERKKERKKETRKEAC
jgi:hypothetical protein